MLMSHRQPKTYNYIITTITITGTIENIFYQSLYKINLLTLFVCVCGRTVYVCERWSLVTVNLRRQRIFLVLFYDIIILIIGEYFKNILDIYFIV